MAVPNSGQLSQLAIAQEALYGTYGSGTITGPISLYDMINGGNTNGSGNSYPTVNTNCTPNPADRSYSVLAQVSPYPVGSNPTNYYFNQNIGVASDLAVGDYLFTDTSLTTLLSSGVYEQPTNVNNNNQYYCYVSNPCGPTAIFIVNGVITEIDCDYCP